MAGLSSVDGGLLIDLAVDSGHGANLERLRKIKTTYDPENLFRLNNSITPG